MEVSQNIRSIHIIGGVYQESLKLIEGIKVRCKINKVSYIIAGPTMSNLAKKLKYNLVCFYKGLRLLGDQR